MWADAIAELISYRYLGCRSILHDGFEATGRMPIRSDMRHGGTLLAAPVAIAMLDTAGIAVDRHWQLALTRVDVNLIDTGSALTELAVRGSLTRQARTQVFTECSFHDAARPEVCIGSGTADWTVISQTPSGFEYIDPGDGVADTEALPPLAEAYDAVPDGSGGFVIPELTARLGGPVLHHGPALVALEAAALAQVPPATWVESLSLRLVRAGKQGPFYARAHVLASSTDTTLIRADLRQGADDGDLIATATLRLRT